MDFQHNSLIKSDIFDIEQNLLPVQVEKQLKNNEKNEYVFVSKIFVFFVILTGFIVLIFLDINDYDADYIVYADIPTPHIKNVVSNFSKYQPSLKPSFFNKTSKQQKYEDECMQFINGEEETNISEKCFTNEK